MPFCIKMLSNICVIRTVSAKTCLLDFPRRWGFRASSHKIFDLGAAVLHGKGGGAGVGMLTDGID